MAGRTPKTRWIKAANRLHSGHTGERKKREHRCLSDSGCVFAAIETGSSVLREREGRPDERGGIGWEDRADGERTRAASETVSVSAVSDNPRVNSIESVGFNAK